MTSDDYSRRTLGEWPSRSSMARPFADVDGDGIPDFIVGKTYWSHAIPTSIPILTVRRFCIGTNGEESKAPGGAEFVRSDPQPLALVRRAGVDLNNDGAIDIVTSTVGARSSSGASARRGGSPQIAMYKRQLQTALPRSRIQPTTCSSIACDSRLKCSNRIDLQSCHSRAGAKQDRERLHRATPRSTILTRRAAAHGEGRRARRTAARTETHRCRPR